MFAPPDLDGLWRAIQVRERRTRQSLWTIELVRDVIEQCACVFTQTPAHVHCNIHVDKMIGRVGVYLRRERFATDPLADNHAFTAEVIKATQGLLYIYDFSVVGDHDDLVAAGWRHSDIDRMFVFKC